MSKEEPIDFENIPHQALQQYIREETFAISFLQTHDDQGDELYIYMAIPTNHLEAFAKLLNSNEFFTPGEHGVILDAGKGKPTQATKRLMKYYYDYDSENEQPYLGGKLEFFLDDSAKEDSQENKE